MFQFVPNTANSIAVAATFTALMRSGGSARTQAPTGSVAGAIRRPNSQSCISLLLPRLSWRSHIQAQGCGLAGQWQEGRLAPDLSSPVISILTRRVFRHYKHIVSLRGAQWRQSRELKYF